MAVTTDLENQKERPPEARRACRIVWTTFLVIRAWLVLLQVILVARSQIVRFHEKVFETLKPMGLSSEHE